MPLAMLLGRWRIIPLAEEAPTVADGHVKAALIRCVFGNPFRPSAIAPSLLAWEGGTARRLAEDAYEERALPSGHLDTRRLAVLAEALEEAGANADLLDPLRGPAPHVRGCWVIDLILGRQ